LAGIEQGHVVRICAWNCGPFGGEKGETWRFEMEGYKNCDVYIHGVMDGKRARNGAKP